MSGAKAAFAPLPARAIGDKRLSGLHFRVLAAIAMHDRMSASRGRGQGCWAGNKTLAVECGCDYSRLSATITDLGKWGYAEREQHPLNKRLRVYRIIYTDADITFTKASNSLPTGKASTPDDEQTVCEPAKSDGETVCRDFQESEQNQQGAGVNIFRETEKILGETLEESSTEVARSGERARCEGFDRRNVGAYLTKVQAWLLSERKHDDDALERVQDELENIAGTFDHDDPLCQWTGRVLEEVLTVRGFYDETSEATR